MNGIPYSVAALFGLLAGPVALRVPYFQSREWREPVAIRRPHAADAAFAERCRIARVGAARRLKRASPERRSAGFGFAKSSANLRTPCREREWNLWC